MPAHRKPKTIKLLEGNRSRLSLDYDEPAGLGLPKMPPGLDAVGKACWEAHIGQIIANGACEGDSVRIAGMCQLYSRYVKLGKEIDKSGGMDYRKVILCGLAWKNYDAGASRFGLSPGDRARLRTEPPKKKTSKWESLLA